MTRAVIDGNYFSHTHFTKKRKKFTCVTYFETYWKQTFNFVGPRYSRTLDDALHNDTNTEINTSRYTCHICAHKSILNMLKVLVTCEKMHMVLVVMLNGLSQHSYPNPSPFTLGLDSDTCAEINPSRTPTNAICI